MFRTALRNVLAHKARLLMTVLAVTLGVAFVSGTLVFTDTLKKSLSGQSAKSYEGIAVSVTSYGQGRNEQGEKEGEPGLGQQTLDKIKALPGVDTVSGRVSGFAGVGDENGKLIGSGWSNQGANYTPVKDGKDPRYAFAQGAGPAKADEVALDKATADKGNYKVGDKVRVATNGPVKEYSLAGVFTTEDGAVQAGGSLVLFETKVAQELYLKPGYFQELSVGAKNGTSADKLLADIKPLLDKNTKAQTGAALAAEQAKQIEKGLSNLSTMLLVFAGISLFVGIFLIYNTFTMLVTQRTKELALLRAVGANRGQVMRSVLSEALVVGVLSAAVGLVSGIGLAIGIRSVIGSLGAKLPGGALVIAPGTVTAALVIGVVVTTVAAVLPAWRTGRIAPVAAMGSAHLPATSKSLLVRNILGSIISLGGIGLVFLGVSTGGNSGRMTMGGGAFFMLIGMIVLLPLLSKPVIGAVRPLLQKVFGVPGKLAAQNAVRNPRRTAVTAASLAIGLTLVTTLSVLGITVGKVVDRMSTEKLKADYRVSMSSDAGSLDKSVAETLSKAPGIKAVSPQTAGYFLVDGDFRAASGVNPATIGQLLNVEVLSGSLDSLGKGEVAVAEKTAKKQNFTVGTPLKVKYDDGQEASVKVGAIFKDMEGLLSPYVIDNKILTEHSEEMYIPEVYVNVDGGASKAAQQKVVDALGKNPAITVATQQDMRNEMGGMINTMLNIMYGLLGMALVISVLGVVNTLAMSVFERTQEIGMLRAIGLDRSRVKNMIRLEAVVISLFGAALGVVIGIFLAWAVGSTLAEAMPGYALILPWDRIGIFLLLAAVVGVLAAMWPARSAARLNMLTAIKTE
ncbi:ABC transporter permease [Streptomyces erythrochromogenes]|uniref:ABC transporter permease n=1 Tax=Streptomyces erythrochromogenes TaxID=285574 RepID=A0ABZ1QEI9_9ACTN|nr:ABC transporter permease [Streptomyces erythrochromogenes]MCX5586429.1 ABC transporter permease [Streptomyces erythrochromogenes]